MAVIKAIISNNTILQGCLALAGIGVAAAGVVNLAGTWQPADKINAAIVERLRVATVSVSGQDRAHLAALKTLQIQTLARKPAEPFAWQRLAWLRLAADYDRAGALAALKMSDAISPYEPRQLAERALLWWRLRDAESEADKAYQGVLWARAFTMQPVEVVRLALTYNLTPDIGVAIQNYAPDLQKKWTWMAEHPGF